MTEPEVWLIPCQVCSVHIEVDPPKLTEFVRVRWPRTGSPRRCRSPR